MPLREFKTGRVRQGSLKKGEDIVEGLIAVLKGNAIAAGTISGIGALSEARIGYFNARTQKYEEKVFEGNIEVLSLKGNVSLKENEIFPHMHVVLSGKDFSAFGGHLFSGIVYAFEFEIVPFEGKPFVRGFDKDTGLSLWKE